MPSLVVIGCGRAKRPVTSPARLLYTGSYFLLCQRAALALRPDNGYLILSAKYGLVTPDTELEPYDLRMGQPGSVSAAVISDQAERLGYAAEDSVVVLASRRYADMVRTVWPHAVAPLLSAPGMGHQRRVLSLITMEGRIRCPG